MNLDAILAAIDLEISKLQRARALLVEGDGAPAASGKKRPGRPRGTMSPAAKKRISDAMKKRWVSKRKS